MVLLLPLSRVRLIVLPLAMLTPVLLLAPLLFVVLVL